MGAPEPAEEIEDPLQDPEPEPEPVEPQIMYKGEFIKNS